MYERDAFIHSTSIVNSMRIVLSFLLINLLLIASTEGQNSHVNPFFNEVNFFNSSHEKDIFNNIHIPSTISSASLLMAMENKASDKSLQLETLIKNITGTIERKNFRNEMTLLKYLFVQVHHKYLKKYQKYSTFNRLLEDGSYDCLTGTGLYALVLGELGFSYEIHETALHCYLKTYANNTPVLFECTDPLNGFVNQQDIIAEMEQRYSREVPQELKYMNGLTGFKHTEETVPILYFNKVVGLREIAGLNYYNQAVIKYNIKDYKKAVTALEKSYTLYKSVRALNMMLLSINQLLSLENISAFEKRLYTGKINFYSKAATITKN